MTRRNGSHFEDDGVQDYLAVASHHRVLTREEEVEIFQRIEAGDETAREEMLACNLRFVIKIALQFRGLGVALADLIQEGNIGLLHVVSKFDWRRGFRFSTYAAYYIRQEIQTAIHRHASMIRLPIRKARLVGKIQETIRHHVETVGREPDAVEVAAIMGLPVEKIESLMSMRHSFTSIDAERNDEGMTMNDTLPSAAAAPSEEIGRKQTNEVVAQVLDFLTDREREVVRLRYGFATGRSQSLRKASKVIGLSQEGVRRVEHRAILKLRRPAIRQRVEGLLTA